MEQRATTLKTMLDVVNYINGKYTTNVVHGLMMQAHIGITDFSVPNAIEDKLRKIEKLVNVARNSGFEVSIYEFDHKIFEENFYRNTFQSVDDSGNIIRVGEHRVATDADFIRQAQIYKDCVKIFLNQGVCQFQVWDDTDPGSWKNLKYYTHINIGTATAPNWRPVRVGDNVNRYPTSNITQKAHMTLFDENVRPKPCYNEILSLLKTYTVSNYNSKKSIFSPYNVLNYHYSDLASMGD
jgi:GH35 family endo-1,4-beta-xylanase